MNKTKGLYLSIVIPVYNEQRRITRTLRYIESYLKKVEYRYEIIVVDDGSKDKTKEIVRQLQIPHLSVVSYGQNMGKGYAVNFGMLKATGEFVLFCDADNATPFEQVEKLLDEMNDYEVAIGSRYIKGSNIKLKQPFLRRLLSRMGNLLIQMAILPGYSDTQCGFKIFRHECVAPIFRRQTIWRWGFDMEVLVIARSLKYKIKQVPVDWIDRDGSRLQSSNVFAKTLGELFNIKMKKISGQYK